MTRFRAVALQLFKTKSPDHLLAEAAAPDRQLKRALGAFDLTCVGIGAVIGATANYTAIRSLARNADEFFARLPYSAIEVDSMDVTGRAVARAIRASRRAPPTP